MSLRPPRRIFARRKRPLGASFALRSCAILAFAFSAAFGATVMAERRPFYAPAADRNPVLSGVKHGPHETPMLRLAATGPSHTARRSQP